MRDQEYARCTYCDETKPLSAFYLRRDRDRLRPSSCCRACTQFARTPEGKEFSRKRREARGPYQRPVQPCQKCGGPKPRGRGWKLCEDCDRAHDIRDARPPCARCGVNDRAPRVTICEACAAAREAERSTGSPCGDCGEPKPFARKFCDACRDVRRQAVRDAIRERNRETARANPEENARRAKAWREANPERARASIRAWEARNEATMDAVRLRAKTKRRMREAEAYVEDVDPLVLLERDDGACGICGLDVDPLSFHVDHIVPLSRGGLHEMANCQPAHPACNSRKSNKLPDELAA